MDYHLITCAMPTTFDTEVNGHLRLGWELYGPPFLDPRSGALCQAVVKRPQPTSLLAALAEEAAA